ncbi:GTP-binding protein 1 [Reticulomyxa filosa]|uniref:GTP-binding protein 1 n=1 Tax=Reticulomyxa filosa TaxID=46433 RepID=X6MKH1_RETFI|nr:GTP-binding protein 1 [Reticulomyxa filosa]|eukprot:ETO14349.1 GTP-binding protein 1 [Reticulomyxa filosa]
MDTNKPNAETASENALQERQTENVAEEKKPHKEKKPKREEINDVPKSDRSPMDVRVAVIGNVDSGKSTMIGVLTSGELDDGRENSCEISFPKKKKKGSSQHIVGFDDHRNPVHQPIAISANAKQKTEAWKSVVKTSNNIITFIDLAGHEKYLKTTISGLTGCFPDYAFIVVGANMGISKMTKEHIQVAVALCVPLFVVCTKVDIAPETVLTHTLKQLAKLLRSPACNKMPIIMKRKKDIDTCFERDKYLERICPVFLWQYQHVGVDDGREEGDSRADIRKERQELEAQISGELEIDETFAVKGVGIVLSGTVTAGKIFPEQVLYLGPFADSTYKEIAVRSIHIKRVPVDFALAGEACSIAFRFVKKKDVVERSQIRKGMVAVSELLRPLPVWAFRANILVLHHPTQINPGYQPVVHCGNIRQTVTILRMSQERLRSGDSALVDLKFLSQPEFVHLNRAIIIREGNTKCIGKIMQVYNTYDPSNGTFTDYINALEGNEQKQKEGTAITSTSATATTATAATAATAVASSSSSSSSSSAGVSTNTNQTAANPTSSNATDTKVDVPPKDKDRSNSTATASASAAKSRGKGKSNKHTKSNEAADNPANGDNNDAHNAKQGGGKSRPKKSAKDSKSKTDKHTKHENKE